MTLSRLDKIAKHYYNECRDVVWTFGGNVENVDETLDTRKPLGRRNQLGLLLWKTPISSESLKEGQDYPYICPGDCESLEMIGGFFPNDQPHFKFLYTVGERTHIYVLKEEGLAPYIYFNLSRSMKNMLLEFQEENTKTHYTSPILGQHVPEN